MKRALVCVVLAACSSSNGAKPPDTGSNDPGPDAAVGNPDQDSDGDGVADVADNCPKVANADQHDHDGDGRGDACDVCPHLKDTGADVDGDGVGDACDPRPTTAGDKIVMFEGFYDAVSWNAVVGDGSSWQFDGSVLHEPDTAHVNQLIAPGSFGDVFVDVRLRVDGVSPSMSRHSASVVLGYVATDDYYFCALATSSQTPILDAGKMLEGTAQFQDQSTDFDGPMIGDWMSIQARTTSVDLTGSSPATHLDCAGTRGQTTAQIAYDADNELAAGGVGLRTNGVDASFDYVFVVQVPMM